MTMGYFLVISVIATTAIYGQCFAAQIGYAEVPGLDINIPPRDLHRHDELPSPFSCKEYYRVLPDPPPIDPPEREVYLPKVPEPPSIGIYPSERKRGSSEEHSYEPSESLSERHHTSEESHHKSTPIHITYMQLHHPRKIRLKHPQELNSKQPAADVSASLVLSFFQFLINNLSQSPQISPLEGLPRKDPESSGNQKPLSGDPSRKQPESDAEQFLLASLPISSSDKTQKTLVKLLNQSPAKQFERNQPQLPQLPNYEFLFHSFRPPSPVNRSDRKQTAPEEFPSEDALSNYIDEFDRLYVPELLDSKHLESDELISIFPESSGVKPSDKNIFLHKEPFSNSPESSLNNPSDRTNSLPGLFRVYPTFPPIDASGMKHILPRLFHHVPPTSLPRNSFEREKYLSEEAQGKLTESPPMNSSDPLALLDGYRDLQDLKNEALETLDGEPRRGSFLDDRPQGVPEKRKRRGAKCYDCKPFKTSHWLDPPI